MSQIRILLVLPNKEAVIVATTVNRWVCIYGAMDILQSDNCCEFKGVCLELMKSFGVCIRNGQPWTP